MNYSCTEMAAPSGADHALFNIITDTGIASQSDMPPGHTCIMMGQYMAEFHNTLIRTYNAAYSQALGVKPGSQDAADPQLYCQSSVHLAIAGKRSTISQSLLARRILWDRVLTATSLLAAALTSSTRVCCRRRRTIMERRSEGRP
jgi:hypothetical protein